MTSDTDIICPPHGGQEWPPDDLVHAILSKKSTLFVGSGVSVGLKSKGTKAGEIGGWDWLKGELLGSIPEYANLDYQTRDTLGKKYGLDLLDYFLAHSPYWRRGLGQLFDLRVDQPDWVRNCPDFMLENRGGRTDYFEALRIVCSEFHRVVTTNYDNLLGDPGLVSWQPQKRYCIGKSATFAKNALSRDSVLVQLHGNALDDPDNCIVTASDYDKAYGPPLQTIPVLLRDLFSEHNVLFIGFSLNDPDIRRTLRMTQRGSRHFALLPVPDLRGNPCDDLWDGHKIEKLASLVWNVTIYWLCPSSDSQIPPKTFAMLIALQRLIHKVRLKQAESEAGLIRYSDIDELAEAKP